MSAVSVPLEQVTNTLLIVDDEAAIVASVKRILRHYDFHIVSAHSAQQALEIMARQPVSVILADYKMPGMSGAALLRHVHQHFPAVIGLMFSGEEDFDTVIELLNEQIIHRFVAKPWQNDQLTAQITQAMALAAGKATAVPVSLPDVTLCNSPACNDISTVSVHTDEYTLIACYADTHIIHGFDRFTLQNVISRVTGLHCVVTEHSHQVFWAQIGLYKPELLCQLDNELRRLLSHSDINREQLAQVYHLCGLHCTDGLAVTDHILDGMVCQLSQVVGGFPVWLPRLREATEPDRVTETDHFSGFGVIPQADLSSGLISSLQLLHKWPAPGGYVSLSELAQVCQMHSDQAIADMLKEAERLLRFSPDIQRLVLPVASAQLQQFGFALNLHTMLSSYHIAPHMLVLECDDATAMGLTAQGLHNLALITGAGMSLQVVMSQPDMTIARQLLARGVTGICLRSELFTADTGHTRHPQTEQFMAWCVEHHISVSALNLADITQARQLGQRGVRYGAGECIGRVAGRDKIRQQLVMQPLQRSWQTQ